MAAAEPRPAARRPRPYRRADPSGSRSASARPNSRCRYIGRRRAFSRHRLEPLEAQLRADRDRGDPSCGWVGEWSRRSVASGLRASGRRFDRAADPRRAADNRDRCRSDGRRTRRDEFSKAGSRSEPPAGRARSSLSATMWAASSKIGSGKARHGAPAVIGGDDGLTERRLVQPLLDGA